jgi:hypothetical protein
MLAFERLAEEKIRDAMAAGEFDHLPGKGKPLSFDEPVGLRPEERLAFIVLKNSSFLPEHLQLRKELERHLIELENFQKHCRNRLGKLIERLRANSVLSLQNQREPNSVSRRGKKMKPASHLRNSRMKSGKPILQQAYFDERRWLRNRLCELAHQAAATAQRLYAVLVEREIREHRPLVPLLSSGLVSVEDILQQFDHEFPADPLEFDGDKTQSFSAGAFAP